MSAKVPLYLSILNQMREQILAGHFRPGDRLPSENDIASHFGVSVITSKRVLNELADERLVVRTKGKGSFVAGNDGDNILHSERLRFRGVVGVVLPSICMPVESELFYLIQGRLHQLNYQTLIRVTDDRMDKEIEAIRMFRLFGVRGFIVFPAAHENYNEEILRLSLERFPHVLVDRRLPSITSSFVVSDNASGIAQIVAHLTARGHQRIVVVSHAPNAANVNAQERVAGFEREMTERGYLIDRSLFFLKRAELTDLETLDPLRVFFSARPDVTAVIAVDTPMAIMSYRALRELGRDVPKDVYLACFDDPKLAHVPYVEQDLHRIAARAVEILTRQMEGPYQIVCEHVPVRLETEVEYPRPFGIQQEDRARRAIPQGARPDAAPRDGSGPT